MKSKIQVGKFNFKVGISKIKILKIPRVKFKILKSKLGDQTVKFEKLAFYLVITTFKLEISTLKFEF